MKLELQISKKADKFFNSHKNIYEKFKANLIATLNGKSQNIDIKKLQTNHDIYRMRVGKYRDLHTR